MASHEATVWLVPGVTVQVIISVRSPQSEGTGVAGVAVGLTVTATLALGDIVSDWVAFVGVEVGEGVGKRVAAVGLTVGEGDRVGVSETVGEAVVVIVGALVHSAVRAPSNKGHRTAARTAQKRSCVRISGT